MGRPCGGNSEYTHGSTGCRHDNSVNYGLSTKGSYDTIYSSDFNNLYSALEREARRRGYSNSFSRVSSGSIIDDSDYNRLRNSSVISVSSVSAGSIITTAQFNAAVNAVNSSGRQCLCYSNYCSCNCNNCVCVCNDCGCVSHY